MYSKYVSTTFSSHILLHFYGEMEFPVLSKVKSRGTSDYYKGQPMSLYYFKHF